jgi:hypothetical protein
VVLAAFLGTDSAGEEAFARSAFVAAPISARSAFSIVLGFFLGLAVTIACIRLVKTESKGDQ